jgi:hypothetical protein
MSHKIVYPEDIVPNFEVEYLYASVSSMTENKAFYIVTAIECNGTMKSVTFLVKNHGEESRFNSFNLAIAYYNNK